MQITRKHILAGVIGGAIAGPADLLAATAQFGAPLEIARPWLNGTLFGLAMFTVMRFIITPLSAANHNPMPPLVLAESLLVHAFIFGLPVALAANFVLRSKD